MTFDNEFDAVFSNAALHWMLDPAAVVKAVAKALRPGGRFVAEMGGKGNIQNHRQRHSSRGFEVSPVAAIAPVLSIGQRIQQHSRSARPGSAQAQLFDRPTPLEGESGMENWLKQFKDYYFEDLPATAIAEVVSDLRPQLHTSNGWHADYRRLRFVAVKS